MSSHPSPGRRGKILEDTLQIHQSVSKAKTNLLWGCINGTFVAVLAYDLLHRHEVSQRFKSFAFQVEFIFACVILINSVFHFVKYMSRSFYLSPVCLSPSQKQVLGINPSDPHFKTSPRVETFSTPKKTDVNTESDFNVTSTMNLSTTSWLSPAVLNESAGSSSPNYSMSSPSWVYHHSSPPVVAAPVLPPVVVPREFIYDEQSLTQYLEDYEVQEKKASVGVSVEQSTNLFSSFWNSNNNTSDVSPLLRRCTYQVAPLSPAPITSSPGAAVEETSPLTVAYNLEVWRQLKVDSSSLTQWNANLRMWISQTILQRLVKEFDNIDEAFQHCGLSDMRLGSVGLERLKKTAAIQQVAFSIPSLPRLVPFLELSPHQEYLVARVRELAKGGSMSEYRWHGGGSINGKNWEEHLPTDAAVIMHLIATYLDSQLLPVPHLPDGRPFTTQHYVRSPEKPPKSKNSLLLYQSQLNPPHFVLVDNEDSFEVAKGRNNLFQTFLLFLHLLKTKEHGMLGRVNLGPSGVNILWVIDS